MPNKKMAKRSVAVKACKTLHERGELNDHLMPINKKKCIENNRGTYLGHWKQFQGGTQMIFIHSTIQIDRITNICHYHLIRR